MYRRKLESNLSIRFETDTKKRRGGRRKKDTFWHTFLTGEGNGTLFCLAKRIRATKSTHSIQLKEYQWSQSTFTVTPCSLKVLAFVKNSRQIFFPLSRDGIRRFEKNGISINLQDISTIIGSIKILLFMPANWICFLSLCKENTRWIRLRVKILF